MIKRELVEEAKAGFPVDRPQLVNDMAQVGNENRCSAPCAAGWLAPFDPDRVKGLFRVEAAEAPPQGGLTWLRESRSWKTPN